MAGVPVARPHSGSAELHGAARRALGRSSGGRAGALHVKKGTLNVFLGQPAPAHNVHPLRGAALLLQRLACPDEQRPEDAAEPLELLG